MEQRGLAGGRVMLGKHRMVALSGVVVALMVVWPAKAYAMISPKDGMVEDGGSRF
jgi:hypothetical protein